MVWYGMVILCWSLHHQVWFTPISESLKTKKPILKHSDLGHIFSNLPEIVQVQQVDANTHSSTIA
jgi:hypothetical protein